MRTRIFCLAPAMVDVYAISRPYHACMHTHTPGTPRTHACMCTHTHVTFRPESKSDLGSCETILRDRLKREFRTRLALGYAYTVYARARTRLSACADDRTYVYPENRSRFILLRANALGNYSNHFLGGFNISQEAGSLPRQNAAFTTTTRHQKAYCTACARGRYNTTHEPFTREADTSRVCWQTSQLHHTDKLVVSGLYEIYHSP